MADDLARLGERAELAERDRLDEQVAEQRRLLRAREHRQPGGAAVQRQSSSLRAPPPTMCISGGAAPVDRGEQVDRLRVLQGQALEDAANDRAGVRRLGLAGARRRTRGSAPACRRASAKTGWFGSTSGPERRRGLGEATSSLEGVARARSRPGAAAFVQEPEAGDVAQQARCRRRRPRSSGSPRRLVVDQRLATLDADERPGAGADVRRAGLRGTGSPRPPSRCRGSRRRRPSPRRGPSRRRPRRRAGPSAVPGRTTSGSRRVGHSRRSSRSSAQSPARGSKHWVVVAFVHSAVRAPAEPVVDEVGDQQQRLRRRERRVALGRHRGELEDRVDRHELDAGALVELARRHPLEHAVHRRAARRVSR